MFAAALGWLGMGGTFAAYLLLAQGRLGSDSLGYAALNALGGLLGGVASVLYGAWPSVASNVVWATIGLHSVVVAVQRRVRAAGAERRVADEAPLRDGARECLV